jgi:hypothetical protein
MRAAKSARFSALRSIAVRENYLLLTKELVQDLPDD